MSCKEGFLCLCACLLLVGGLGTAQGQKGGSQGLGGGDFSRLDADLLKACMAPFPMSAPNGGRSRYLAYYNLEYPGTAQRYGFLRLKGFKLFTQSFEPESPRGTVLFLHGFLDHSATHDRVIQACLDRRWAVYCLDLPGHGLSEGQRGGTEDFCEYGQAAALLYQAAIDNPPRGQGGLPIKAIGHSTGCAAWLMFLEGGGAEKLSGVLFGGPLVRSAFWDLSKASYLFSAGAIDRLPHGRGPAGRIDLYPYAFTEDPLYIQDFPINWVRSLFAWNQQAEDYGAFDVDLRVIQGTADDVVDFSYNIPFLRQRCARLTARYVTGGSHHVFRYKGSQWQAVLEELDSFLGGPDR